MEKQYPFDSFTLTKELEFEKIEEEDRVVDEC